MADGFYRTGDVAQRDADGYITYVGRADDVFKSSDYRISPFELESALIELGRWNETLVLTYAEFGRRPKENLSLGTDHGTANVHFALGGRVAGGLYGEALDLTALTGDGNPRHALDFRDVYATALERWWKIDARSTLGGRFTPVPFLRA